MHYRISPLNRLNARQPGYLWAPAQRSDQSHQLAGLAASASMMASWAARGCDLQLQALGSAK